MISPSSNSAIQSNYLFHRPARWKTLAACGAAAAVAVAGCSGGSPSTTSGPTSAAQRQVSLAASTSAKVATLTASVTEQLGGTTPGNMTGTVQIQLKPAPIIEARYNVASKTSPTIKLDEILTSNAVYFKNPAFKGKTGKPWIKVLRSQLASKSGAGIASMLQNLEGSNPLDQTQLFTASKDVHVVGHQQVTGLATTEYAGSYKPSAAFARLTGQLRTLLGPMLRALGKNSVLFHVWIDAQHLIRKADVAETVHGQKYLTTFVVTSINQPIKVTLPTPATTAPLPKV